MYWFSKVFSSVIIALYIVLASGCGKDSVNANKNSELISVEVLNTAYEDVVITTTLNGVVSAYESADIRPQVSGIIRDQFFLGGEKVTKGEPLYQIDDRPFKNKYDYAEASYHKDLAKFDLVSIKLKRYSNLLKTNSVSLQELEDVKAEYAENKAQMQISKSNFEDAKLNLEYTKVLSPIDGIVGRSTVTKGALVTANQSEALTSVTVLSKVYVDLQQSATSYQNNLLKIKDGDLVVPKEGIKVTLNLGNSKHRLEGIVKFHEVKVNESTGNLVLRCEFDNHDGILLPGMNVTATMVLGIKKQALVIPEKALTREARGDVYVYLVKDGESVKQKVKVLSLEDGRYLVEDGLQLGDKVIISGKKLLKNHTKVQVQG